MEKTIFFLITLLMSTLCWQGIAKTGNVCDTPIAISELPFSTFKMTSNYRDDCGTNNRPTSTPSLVGKYDGEHICQDDVVYNSFSPPENDSCYTAIVLECNNFPETYSSVGSIATNITSCYMGSSGIWFTFLGTGADITVNSTATFDHEMSINYGECHAMVNVYCQDTADSGGMESYTITNSLLNEAYYIYVAHSSGSSSVTGEVNIQIYCTIIPDCIPPTLTLSTQDSDGNAITCLNAGGEYYVLASLSGGFVNSSYYVSANSGTPIEVNANSSHVFGPFTIGTNVSITAVGAQDGNCSVTESVLSPGLCPPENNNCTGAIALTCGTPVTGTTYYATDSGLGTPSCAGGSLQDVFFTLNVIAGGEYTITINGADYDGVLVTYTGSCGSLTELNCADNGFSAGVPESITFTATATETIIIRTYDWSTSGGSFTITVNCNIEDFVYENGAWSPSDPNVDAGPIDNITVINGITSFNTDIEVNNITVMNGATLNVEGVLTINGDITNNGDLVFVSTATSNGELASVSGTSTITGNITVERYMKAKRSYRMLSSAVTTTTSIHDNWQEVATIADPNPNPGFGTHITGSTTGENGFDSTFTGNYSMFTVDVGSQQFQAVTNTDVNTLTAGNPYLLFVRGDRSINLDDNNAAGQTVLRATGSLVIGTSTQNFATEDAGDFAMFGNPYQSAVDINSVFANATNVNTGYYYVYDPSLGDNGAYVTVNLPGGTNTSSSAANQYLQPGQGGQLTSLAPGPSSVVFNESDKTPGQFTATNRPLSGNDMLTVQLYTTENFNTESSVHDSFGIVFAEVNDNSITPADAVKPMNFYENLGIDRDGIYLSLEQREMPQASEVYQFYTSGYQHADYTLKVLVNGLEGSFLYLQDHFTGISTLLDSGDNNYSFSVDSNNELSKATDRFAIRTEQRLGLDDNNLLSGISLYPNPLNGEIFYINAPRLNGEQLLVSISDLSGRRIFEQVLEFRANTVTVPIGGNIASGVYMVILKKGDESQTYRLLKK